jgi:hypothetical protein
MCVAFLQEEERRLRDEHIQYQQQLSDVQRKRQEDILVREEMAKKNVMERLKERRKALMRREVKMTNSFDNLHQ